MKEIERVNQTPYAIPFNKPWITPEDVKYLALPLKNGPKLSGDGPYNDLALAQLRILYPDSKILLTPSATAALEMMALILRLSPSDEVLIPNFTFVSTANAFALRGCKVRLLDIEPATLNIDPAQVAKYLTKQTKAVVTINYGGRSGPLNKLEKLCATSPNAVLLEDAAQCIGAKDSRGRALGSVGALGALSFHETKNVTCGEGGALIINDLAHEKLAEIIREKGTNRSQVSAGLAEKYFWHDLGSSYLLSDVNAALLTSQLKRLDALTEKRRQICLQYETGLKGLAENGFLKTPGYTPQENFNGHVFYIITRTPEERVSLSKYLRDLGILSVFHYLPLDESPAAKQYAIPSSDLRVSKTIAHNLLRLPVYYNLSLKQVKHVINSVIEYYKP